MDREPLFGSKPIPFEVNIKPAPQYDMKFIERDMQTYVRMPSLVKWTENGFGELVCSASIYSWNSVSYRIAFNTKTLLDNLLITAEFSSTYLPGQQFFVDLLLDNVRMIGENRGPFVDPSNSDRIQVVKARRLSRRDGNFSFPLLKAKDCQVCSYMALRGDRNGTAFEGWDKENDEFCHVFLPLQRCSRQLRDIRVANGLPNYSIDKGGHICPSQLSMLPLTGKRVPMPNWLNRLFRDIRRLKYLLVDFEVYKGWQYAFATILGFSDSEQVPPQELMEVSVEDMLFNLNYGPEKIKQSIRHSEKERQRLLGTRCLIYLHRNLPGWGLPHYSIRLWHPENEDVIKFWKEREGRSSFTEYPTGPTNPTLSQYYYDFISGATDCAWNLKTVASVKTYEVVDLDLEGLDLLNSQSLEPSLKDMDNQSILATLFSDGISSNQTNEHLEISSPPTSDKNVLDDIIEQSGHPYPTNNSYCCDRISPVVKHVFEPRWRIWMDSAIHNDERLRQIISAAKHQLTREAESLTAGFRLRIDWEPLFLELRDRPGPLTRSDVHVAVHKIVTDRVQLFEEKPKTIEQEEKPIKDAELMSVEEAFANRYQQILERIRNAPTLPNGFWPTLRLLSKINSKKVKEITKEPVCEKLIDVD